jgi:hypothetical protein
MMLALAGDVGRIVTQVEIRQWARTKGEPAEKPGKPTSMCCRIATREMKT